MDNVSHIALAAGSTDAAAVATPVTGPTVTTFPGGDDEADVRAVGAAETPAEDATTPPATAPPRERRSRRTAAHVRSGWQPTDRIIDEAERAALTGYCRGYYYRLEAQGSVPRRIKLGARKVGWLLSEVEAWLAERAAQRTAAPPPDPAIPIACSPARRR